MDRPDFVGLPLPRKCDKPWYVYILQDPFTGEWRYIGVTCNPKRRLRVHCKDKNRCHRTNWIQSIIAKGEKPRMKLIHQVPFWCDPYDCEKAWIRYGFDSYWNLTNETIGGRGISNMLPETRAKIGNANRGLKRSEEVRAKHAANLSRFRGRKHTEESKAKLSEAAKRRVHTEAKGRALSEGIRKITDEVVADVLRRISEGEGHISISKALGISTCTISGIRNGKQLYCRKAKQEECP